MQNVKKLIKKKSFLPSRGISDISINEKCTLTSPISASSEAVIHKYDDIQDLIVTAVTAQGLLSQYEPITFMEDFISVASFIVKNKTYEYFAVYDSKTGIKKGGHEVAKECVSYIPKIIKNALKNNNDDIKDLLIKSFEKADEEHFLKSKKELLVPQQLSC